MPLYQGSDFVPTAESFVEPDPDLYFTIGAISMALGGEISRLVTTVALNLFDGVIIDTANPGNVTKATSGVLAGVCVGYVDGKFPGNMGHVLAMNAAGGGIGPAAGAVALIQTSGISVGVADTGGVTIGQHVIVGSSTAGRFNSTASPTAGSAIGRALNTATAGNQFFMLVATS